MKKALGIFGLAAMLVVSSLALAGQHPNAQERAALDTALTSLGFVSWGEIELKRNVWKVEDARKELGSVQKYDLKLEPETFKVIYEKLDK